MKLVVQNNINQLLDQLIADYEQAKTTLGVFGQYTIAVPNKSVENWLSAEIVKRVGISSGIRFESLHNVLRKVYFLGLENSAELVEKSQLAGLLFNTLSALKERDVLANDELVIVKNWLNKQNHQQSLASLSHALADVFELYQIYRTDWLDAWAEHKLIIGGDSEKWQAAIWRLIVSLVPKNTLLHRKQLTDAFQSLAGTEGLSLALKDIQQISIFGVNQLDAITLKQVMLVGQSIPVSLFWQPPSTQLFGSADQTTINKNRVECREAYFSGNALLASWGGLSRQQYMAFDKMGINYQAPEANSDSQPKSLLATIKNKVLNNTETDDLKAELDDSISFNAHFSRYREVEGLYDYLLDRLNKDANLTANDIVVMCPDINAYAPYIHAAFENQPSKQKIPFQLCGIGAQVNDVAAVLLELIGLPETRYALSDIIDLLNHSYLRRRFELSTEEIEQIHAWFKQANVYWGLDKKTLKQLNLPEYDRYTLQCGIDRMVLGLSLDGQSLMLDEQLIYGIEGISALQSDTLSKLITFVDALRCWRDICLSADGKQCEQSVDDWSEKLRVLTADFIDVPHKEAESLNEWHHLISDVEQCFIDKEVQGKYSYAFVKDLLAQKVEDATVSSSAYRYGRVNLGSFGALKGIPAKVVALLGMNESDFPRKPVAESINLTKQHSRFGDRNPVEQDKDAYLMALMNCQSNFYCSYIGNDMRSNAERIPSLLLQELMDFIQSDSDKQKAMINFHPMKAYSDAYFQPETHLFTYQDFTSKTSLLDKNSEQCSDNGDLPKWEMPEQLTIQDLKGFLEDPAKAFFKARFNVNLPSLDDEATDDEPMEANALTRWQFIEQLLQLGLQQGGISNDLQATVGEPYKASGLMEHDHFAENKLTDWAKTAIAVLDNALKVTGQKQPEIMQVDLTLSVDGEAVQLVGDMNIFSDRKTSNIIQLVHKEGSKVSEKYLMRTIVDTRIAEALKLENKLNYESTYLACKDRLFSLSADNNSGCNSLETWARLYKSVMNEPISLDLKSAGKIAADKPYRDAFAQMLEDSTDPYSRFGLSEAMKVLSHDREAVDCSEKYLEHYQYVKPRGKLSKDGDKDKDKGTPHWIEVEDGEQS